MDQKRRGNPNMVKGAPSVNPTGKPKSNARITADGLNRLLGAVRGDGWTNQFTGIGTSRDRREAGTFTADPVTNEEAREMWRGDDLAARIIEMPPKDMFRKGYEVKLDDDKEKAEEVHKDLERLKAGTIQAKAKMFERAYGGAAIFPVINNLTENLATPLNEQRIPEIRHLHLFEPKELVPHEWYEDINHPKYGEPAVWRVVPIGRRRSNAMTLIHETRLIIYPGIRVTAEDVAGVSQGWGDSVLTRIYKVLRDFNMTWAALATLVQDFSQAIMKVEGLAEIIAQDAGGYFQGRMAAMLLTKSVTNTLILDTKEEYERTNSPLTGLPETVREMMSRVAAAAGFPVTRLFGTSATGLNATGEGDEDGYYDLVSGLQQDDQSQVDQLVRFVMLQNDGPTRGKLPPMWSTAWRPLKQESDLEKVQARKVQADTDAVYITAMVLSPEEVALSRFGGDTYSYETVVDFKAREALDEAAPAPVVAEATKLAQEEEAARALTLAKETAPVSNEPTDDGGGPSGGTDGGPGTREDAFDPDQERDENGRWTSTGGGTGAAKTPSEKAARTAVFKSKANKLSGLDFVKEQQADRQKDIEHQGERLRAQLVKMTPEQFAAQYRDEKTPDEVVERAKREALDYLRSKDLESPATMARAEERFQALLQDDEKDAAEVDAAQEKAEKYRHALIAPPVKQLDAYRQVVRDVNKDLQPTVTNLVDAAKDLEKDVRDIKFLSNEIQQIGSDLETGDEALAEFTRDLDDNLGGLSLGEDNLTTVARAARSARELRHVGADSDSFPRLGELDRVEESVSDELLGKLDDERQSVTESNTYDEEQSVDVVLDHLSQIRDRLAAIRQKAETVVQHGARLSGVYKTAEKAMDKPFDAAMEERESIDPENLVAEQFDALDENHPDRVGAYEAAEAAVTLENISRHQTITTGGIGDELRPTEANEIIKSAKTSIKEATKLEKSISKVIDTRLAERKMFKNTPLGKVAKDTPEQRKARATWLKEFRSRPATKERATRVRAKATQAWIQGEVDE